MLFMNILGFVKSFPSKGKEKFHLSVIKTIAAIVQFIRVKQKEQFSIECCK